MKKTDIVNQVPRQVIPVSLNQNVSHGSNTIFSPASFVSTGVGVIWIPSRAKPNSGITARAIFATNYTDSGSSRIAVLFNIEPCLGTAGSQEGIRTNQRLPRVIIRTQWGVAVFPVSDQRVQRIAMLVYDNEVDLMADLHSKTDLGEWCVPVGW